MSVDYRASKGQSHLLATGIVFVHVHVILIDIHSIIVLVGPLPVHAGFVQAAPWLCYLQKLPRVKEIFFP
jgi:hypothetical protein